MCLEPSERSERLRDFFESADGVCILEGCTLKSLGCTPQHAVAVDVLGLWVYGCTPFCESLEVYLSIGVLGAFGVHPCTPRGETTDDHKQGRGAPYRSKVHP